jgi:hypothetical protein
VDLFEFIKPELAVLIPILCYIRRIIKRFKCDKKEQEAFYICFALIISAGYVLSTSQVENSQDFFKCVWLGVSQGIIVLTVCSFTNREPKNERQSCRRDEKKPRDKRG